jgi:hypothetical protein
LSDFAVIRALKLLRCTVSVVAFTACLLLGLLWVRSYWQADDIFSMPSHRQVVHSMIGSLGFIDSPDGWRFRIESESVVDLTEGLEIDRIRALRWVRLSGRVRVTPHWFWMVLFGAVGAAPWMRWRFSVRGVLVLMAFLAAMFAILVFE